MTIPASVRTDQVHEALKPFYDLLGINYQNIYSEPGLTIGPDKITFMVPASTGNGDMLNTRVPGVRRPTEFPHPRVGEVEHSELAYVVTVPMTGKNSMVDVRANTEETNRVLRDIGYRLDAIQRSLNSGPERVGQAINEAAARGRRGGAK